jgi:hypothetical protein
VLIVTNPVGLEFHLDHRAGPRHGQHRVMGEAGFAAWIADAGDPHPSVRVAAACPCQPIRYDPGSTAAAMPAPSRRRPAPMAKEDRRVRP